MKPPQEDKNMTTTIAPYRVESKRPGHHWMYDEVNLPGELVTRGLNGQAAEMAKKQLEAEYPTMSFRIVEDR